MRVVVGVGGGHERVTAERGKGGGGTRGTKRGEVCVGRSGGGNARGIGAGIGEGGGEGIGVGGGGVGTGLGGGGEGSGGGRRLGEHVELHGGDGLRPDPLPAGKRMTRMRGDSDERRLG